MFQHVAPGPRFSPQSFAASLLFHAILILLLWLVGFPGGGPKLHARALRFVLLAPPPERAPVTPRHPLPPPARVFRPPSTYIQHAAAAIPKLTVEISPPAPVDTSHVPAPEMPHVVPPANLPPPIKTGTFAEPTPPAEIKPALQTALKAAGFAAVDPSSPASGSSLLASRTTAPAGFGAAAGQPTAALRRNALPAGSFGDAAIAAPEANLRHLATASAIQPVEILEKPRPAYTEDARRQGIEGEVLLEVLFEASGQARVLGVVRSLGHGLDESAEAAARLIRFKPARREGVAVDATAVVHIVFQLAY